MSNCFDDTISILASPHSGGWGKLWMTDGHRVTWGILQRGNTSANCEVPKGWPQKTLERKLKEGHQLLGELPLALAQYWIPQADARQLTSAFGNLIAQCWREEDVPDLIEAEAMDKALAPLLQLAYRGACVLCLAPAGSLDEKIAVLDWHAEQIYQQSEAHWRAGELDLQGALCRQSALAEALRLPQEARLTARADWIEMQLATLAVRRRAAATAPVARARLSL